MPRHLLPFVHPRRIFCGLGHPGSQAAWPDVEHLRHWREDTGGCRQRRPEHGSINLKQLLWENSPLLRCAVAGTGGQGAGWGEAS